MFLKVVKKQTKKLPVVGIEPGTSYFEIVSYHCTKCIQVAKDCFVLLTNAIIIV